MRLTDREREVILSAVRRHFGEAARVWLFGSRVDDGKRGGDIDLLVDIPTAVDSPLARALEAEVDIQFALDDPRVDILVTTPTLPGQAIHQIARATGAPL
jgi:predicted nucleotidyltransferase